ncbi:MAG: TIGR01906 family membrane protein [Ardenticatenaceae bacterium]|nr:TIGR01906 family membrane protein [Ardenticatenaceae bacterium]
MNNPTVITVVRWLVVIATPFFLGLGGIRALIGWENPTYPEWEYARIAPDQFGFTPEQRLELAQATLAYMQRPEPADEVIYLLEELRLPGTDTPLYNDSEISHMLDVKRVADGIQRVVWVAGVIVFGGLLFLLLRSETRVLGYKAIFQGGLLTTIILVAIAAFIGLAWSTFFVQFHELLFPPGTWTFSYSDSLIRLFPEQFWFDAGIIMSVSPLLSGVVTAVIGYILYRRAV